MAKGFALSEAGRAHAVNPAQFFGELKRRQIYKVAVTYGVVAWLLVQIATQVFPFFQIPNWTIQLVVLFLVLGFPVVLAWVWAFEAGAGKRDDGTATGGRVRVRHLGRKLAASVIVLAILAITLTLFRHLRSQPKTEPADNGIAPRSIAVLPFVNLSDDRSNAYFVSGMRDEVLTSLAQLPELNVRSRISADQYQTETGSFADLGRQLGIAYIIEGSVQKASDNVLINVQLIETKSGEHLWGQSYRRKVQNIFDVQGEVAQQVANALRIKLLPEQEQRLLVPATTSVEAHDLFLRAHALGAHSDEKSLEGKIALLQQAVAEDPHYALAWGDLAGAYLTIADAYRAPREVLGRMRHAARMSVLADEKSGVGHIWLGAVSMLYDRNFPLAKSELQKAVTLNPNSADAHRWLGWYLARVERDFAGGRKELQRARALDPLYTWPPMFECLIQIAQGKYQSAMRLAEQVLEIDPQFFYDVDPIATVYSAEGRWEEARKRYESLPAATLAKPNFQLAICYAHTGQAERARQMLEELEELSRRQYVDQVHLAAIYAALGEKDRAFAALDRACDDRSARVSTPRFYSW